MLRSLRDVLSIDDPTKVDYLAPLINLARRQGALTVATLNYDRSIENVAQLQGADYHTGIEQWTMHGELEWPEDDLKLLKLHGSIDWVVERERQTGNLPMQRVRQLGNADEKAWYERPAVIFGEAGKLQSEGPYLELLLAWANDLKSADTLLVVGYSFRDQHVNEIISRWFNGVPTRRIIVLDRTNLMSAPSNSFAGTLARYEEWRSHEKPPPTPRIQQLVGTARNGLEQAIQAAVTQASPV
jgi:SIR2-like domain